MDRMSNLLHLYASRLSSKILIQMRPCLLTGLFGFGHYGAQLPQILIRKAPILTAVKTGICPSKC